MGIYDRDYVRQDAPRGSHYANYGGDNWAIKYLLIVNVAVFFLQNIFIGQQGGGVSDLLHLQASDLASFQLWRLVTYGFCHGSFQHILFNMFALWMFGRLVEPICGSREFLAFYLVGIVFSGLCFLLFQIGQGGPQPALIGASGGVYAVVFLCAMYYPKLTVLLMFVIPVPFWLLAIGYVLLDLMGALNPGQSNVAHVAHLGGAAYGIAYKYFGWRILPWLQFGNWKLPKRRKQNPEIRAYRPPEESLESSLDRVLDKINKQGEGSLTDEERRILTEASRRFKDRT